MYFNTASNCIGQHRQNAKHESSWLILIQNIPILDKFVFNYMHSSINSNHLYTNTIPIKIPAPKF
jgi:hypothetical protein